MVPMITREDAGPISDFARPESKFFVLCTEAAHESARMNRPVAFIGASGSGKTSLLVELIRYYSGKGISTGAIKHGHHEPHRGSSDTNSFLEAGALQAIYAAGDQFWIFSSNPLPQEGRFLSPDELPSLMNADRILIEGFKNHTTWPRMLVERSGVSSVRVPKEQLIGIVTDEPGGAPLTTFAPEDIESIARFVDRISSR